MPNQTTNYNLTKPLETERYDVQVFNNNADIIDAQMKSNADGIANVNSRLDNLNNWTTVEFTLADFTYDENSGVTYLPIEAPEGYLFEEVRGYIILNKTATSPDAAILSIEPVNQSNNAVAPMIYRTPFGLNNVNNSIGIILFPTLKYNTDLAYVTGVGSYYSNMSNRVDSNALGTISLIRTRPSLNTSEYSQSRIVLKTNVPYTNISEFYGKLQYRVVPA